MKSGIFIFRLREKTGLSQNEFAKKLSVTRGYISQLENDRVDISLSHFIKFCKILKVNSTDIIDDEKWGTWFKQNKQFY